MIKLRQWIGKEIVFRSHPFHGTEYRGILVGYDKDFIYLYQYQNLLYLKKEPVLVQTRGQDGRLYESPQINSDGEVVSKWAWNKNSKITPQMMVARNSLIHVTLAENFEWYEEHKLENPYFLDQWLKRGKRKKEKENRKDVVRVKKINRNTIFKTLGTVGLSILIALLGLVAWTVNS